MKRSINGFFATQLSDQQMQYIVGGMDGKSYLDPARCADISMKKVANSQAEDERKDQERHAAHLEACRQLKQHWHQGWNDILHLDSIELQVRYPSSTSNK